MNAAQLAFYVAIGLAGAAFIVGGIRAARRSTTVRWPTPIEIAIGFVTDFFDTLGIGSFAPTTAIYKLRRMVPDELIPGTLNVGHTTSAIAEALIFVTAILVDPLLLVSVVGAAAAGAWLGAGIVARLPRRAIQVTMGVALLIAGAAFAAKNLGAFPGGGTAMSLVGWKFGLAVGINFVLGALMSAGIGLYAPCMVTLALLGMHPIATFPIMMGASRAAATRGEFALLSDRPIRLGSFAGTFLRRRVRRTDRCVHRQVAAAGRAALAGDRRHYLHCVRHAMLRGAGGELNCDGARKRDAVRFPTRVTTLGFQYLARRR